MAIETVRGHEFIIHFDLPGVDASSIDLTVEKNVNAAIARIEALPTILHKVTRIRLEELGRN